MTTSDGERIFFPDFPVPYGVVLFGRNLPVLVAQSLYSRHCLNPKVVEYARKVTSGEDLPDTVDFSNPYQKMLDTDKEYLEKFAREVFHAIAKDRPDRFTAEMREVLEAIRAIIPDHHDLWNNLYGLDDTMETILKVYGKGPTGFHQSYILPYAAKISPDAWWTKDASNT